MFEDMTYENIMARCIERVPNSLDKREESVVSQAISAAAAELATLYTLLSTQMDRAFPDTATDIDLTNKAKERSVFRLPATYAIRKGVFTDSNGVPMDIPIGSRWSGGDVNFTATAKIETGAFQMTAETTGEAGNLHTGVLFYIDFVENLGSAQLTDVLIYGEEEESDDALRARYMESLDVTTYGGNIADYKSRTEAIPGVGKCKVYPIWNGGGTVKLVITSAGGGVPSGELVSQVQQTIDPPGFTGEGKGIAPIGHQVTVAPVTAETVNIAFTLAFDDGYTWDSLQGAIIAAIEVYFAECVREWADTEQITLRIARVDSAVLTVQGVLDIGGTTLNGTAQNLTLETEEIPQLGTVINNGTP